MKAVVHVNDLSHQQAHGALFKEGLERHGVQVEYAPFNEPRPCDFAVIWGFRQAAVIEAAPHTLVMERGHVGDRQAQTSLGWDGLGRRGRYPWPRDGGKRFRRNFPGLLKPWRKGGRYVLVCGQVPGDAAVRNVNITDWAVTVCRAVARDLDLPVWYRPHPLARSLCRVAPADGIELSLEGDLADDLTEAIAVITYNSTAGVEAALAGVPVVAMDEGAMAWPVATHDPTIPWTRPAREPWAHRLAWCQWGQDEIRSGEAWEHLQTAMN